MKISSGGQDITAATTSSPSPRSQDRVPGPGSSRKARTGWLIAGSLIFGVLAAVLLAAAPFVPATESGVTGAVLVGFALGWAVLAVLSGRFTDQPQTWALAPALFLGLGGVVLMVFGSPMRQVLAWVWPPALLVLAVWMIVPIRRQVRSRSGRSLLYPVIVLLILVSLGGGYEKVREAADMQARPAQGRMIDVGGHRLYLNCTGSGSPTVVIEPGAGATSSEVEGIASAVALETRVCVYDRAGRGWSDPTDTRQDGAQIVADLHTLLQRGNEPGPYVLAGHSFGGLYALTFAARYPDDVAALALIDSTAPATASGPAPASESAHSAATDSHDTASRLSALASSASRIGIARLLGVTSGHFRSTVDEYLLGESSAQRAAALRDFGDKPLVVVTADSGTRAGWAASQDALAALSTNSLHRVIDGATHASLVLDQEDASDTVRGILDAVSAVRTASPLIP